MSTSSNTQPPSPQECLNALSRVSEHPIFRGAPRLAAFLDFVVKETLAGRATSLKAYTIAVAALQRPDDFDPVADPIVRVEAVRLRAALDRYYASAGAQDPVRITMPAGRYIPQFSRRRAGEDIKTATKNSVVGRQQPDRTGPLEPSGFLETYRGLLRTAVVQETQRLVSAIQNLERELATLKTDIARSRSAGYA